jgi:hypothetical protein
VSTEAPKRTSRKGIPNHPVEFRRQLAKLACEPGVFVAPYFVGVVTDATGNTASGMYALAGAAIVGVLLVFTIPAGLVNRTISLNGSK